MQGDFQGAELLSQAQTFREPASPGGEGEEKVGCGHGQEVGAPGRPRVGGEEVQVGAQGHVGGAKASRGQGQAEEAPVNPGGGDERQRSTRRR